MYNRLLVRSLASVQFDFEQSIMVQLAVTVQCVSVPKRHAARGKQEGSDSARLPMPREWNSRCTGRFQTTDLPGTPFRCPGTMPRDGSARAGILSGCPSLDRGSREAKVGFESQTFRSINLPSNHLVHLAPFISCCWLEREFTDRKVRDSNPTSASRIPLSTFGQPDSIPDPVLPSGGMAARHRKSAMA
ncbi:hypothetical protein T265_03842 [Opisthorchis viverrini]|uniref:Uncharacterized protein n=1 Tax=Opisthorchis viverrini TaxID=6198 RepID=A0A074ZQ43_OPIVI|nr:hypothetical protein T265_03842 [Opisthorchis viverrini]KER29543.1 hypothetical protein T265_03842 [Opisthorchis viverrini]